MQQPRESGAGNIPLVTVAAEQRLAVTQITVSFRGTGAVVVRHQELDRPVDG
jgi:hypothetical protein